MVIKTKYGTVVIGAWYVDGFCLSSVIIAIYDAAYQNRIRWSTVKRCSSREEAEAECLKYNQEHFPNQVI